MDRFTILVGRPDKFITPINLFFSVPLVGRFMPIIDVIGRPVESPLYLKLPTNIHTLYYSGSRVKNGNAKFAKFKKKIATDLEELKYHP